jgi:hypothetical protein
VLDTSAPNRRRRRPERPSRPSDVTNPWQGQLTRSRVHSNAAQPRTCPRRACRDDGCLERVLEPDRARGPRTVGSCPAFDRSSTRNLDEHRPAGRDDGRHASQPTESAIRSDPMLSAAEKEALLAVYRSYVREQESAQSAEE